MKKDTILIVDDVIDNVKILRQFLTNVGFNVLIAEDGEEGIQVIEQILPDLILLDIVMPGMNGFRVCQYLKAQKNTKDIPIIFITALMDTANKVKGFEFGAADYITKPFQYEEVLARINTHLTLRKQQQQLQKRHKQLDTFAHTVAHDLKNPISSIIMLTNLFLERHSVNSQLNSKDIKHVNIVMKSAQRMNNIIKALLTLSGVSCYENVTVTPLEMSTIIKPIVQEHLVIMIEEYQAKIDLPNNWPVAVGYAPWVEEIWANYLSNALKYGGTPPHLTLGANQESDKSIRFWVQDNGKGLSGEEMAQLFIPFSRLHQSRTEGHGLGLSIVRQIVEKLGGQAGVESKLGQGSRFYFTLPVVDND